MITELAYLEISIDSSAAFEEAVNAAKPIFAAAKGCRGMRLARVIETPGKYILQVEWDTLENHMVDFRESQGFQEWRKLVSDFFVVPPVLEHTETDILF